MAQKSNGIATDDKDGIVSELSQIKRLLVLLLMKGGSTQTEIAKTLGVGQATISRHYPVAKPSPIHTTRHRQTGETE